MPNFALAYAAESAADARIELGIRTDKSLALASGVLRAGKGVVRYAW